MSDDEQVETSDAEELEIINYWTTHVSGIRTAYSIFDANSTALKLTPNRSTFRANSSPEDGSARPRKRLKLDMTPSSSAMPDGEEDAPLPFSSQTTVESDLPRVFLSPVKSRKRSASPGSQHSQDLLDLIPQNHTPARSLPLSPTLPLFSLNSTPLRPPSRSPSIPPTSAVETNSLRTPPRVQAGSSPLSSPLSSPRPSLSQDENYRNPPSPAEEPQADQPHGRWSFRSRNVHQVHPYQYERIQYKRQMRGIPGAMVPVDKSPERKRRSSTGAQEMDGEFIANTIGDTEESQETGPSTSTLQPSQNSSTNAESGPSRPRVRQVGQPRRQISRIPSVPSHDDVQERVQSPERWYPAGLEDLSSSDSDENPFASGNPLNDDSNTRKQDVGPNMSSPPRRRRRKPLVPKPPPWTHRTKSLAYTRNTQARSSDIEVLDSRGRSVEVNLTDGRTPPGFPSPANEGVGKPTENHSQHNSSVSGSGDSESEAEISRKELKQRRILRRMLPAGLISKHLQGGTKPSRRYTTTPPAELSSTSSHASQLMPGQTKTRVVREAGLRDNPLIAGDSESSDGRRSVIDISSASERSISDVEEIRTQMYPGVLDIPLISDSEDEESDVDMEMVHDVDIGAWLHRHPVHRRRPDRDIVETREGDLIDRMLSRTRVASGRQRTSRVNQGAGNGNGRVRVRRPNGVHVFIGGGARPRKRPRQRRLVEFFEPSSGQVPTGRKSVGRNQEGHTSKHDETSTTKNKSAANQKKMQKKTHPLFVFPTGAGGHVTSGRRHKEGMTIDVEHTSTNTWSRTNYRSPERGPQTLAPIPAFHQAHLAIHPAEFDLLHPGMTFGADTYIGKGWLQELSAVLRDRRVPAPAPYIANGVELTMATDIEQLSNTLLSTLDRLQVELGNGCTSEKYNTWSETLHAICQFVSWVSDGAYEIVVPLRTVAKEQSQRLARFLIAQLDSGVSEEESSFLLFFYWFALELSLRSCSSPHDGMSVIFDLGASLVKHLSEKGPSTPVGLVFPDPGYLVDLTPEQLMYQIWVNLFHLTDVLGDWFKHEPSGLSGPNLHGIWRLVRRAFEGEPIASLDASERWWSVIFNTCAVSQFSIEGITRATPQISASWDVLSLALRDIPLTSDPAADRNTPRRRLVKRDRYIHLIVSRCFFLRNRWSWSLADSSVVFNHLADVFKSRKFANLYGESSDFPSFMRRNDVTRLALYRGTDTAFDLFLKLAAYSVEDMKRNGADPGLPMKLRKLMSILIPVGSVPFNKNAPPSAHELSMFYNRLSAVAVVIHLDSTPINVQNRLNQARRYISFKDSDMSTRRACIRGIMYIAMIIQRMHLPLTTIFDWMTEISNILMDDYQSMGNANKDPRNDARNRIIITLEMLLGSIRHLIESGQALEGNPYPDPAFLQGAWISRVFSAMTDIANLPSTGYEIQRLIQAFLDGRAQVIPRPSRPPIQTREVAEDSQESQDYYEQMDLDFNDPEVRAALGEEPDSPEAAEAKVKDKLVAEIMDKNISRDIYRLVCKRVSDVPEDSVQEHSCVDVDAWIDCWVGCAQVIVQNGDKTDRDWSHYLRLGDQSWQKIYDGSWRRRVGLRFMYTLLVRDPSAYPTYRDTFMEVLLEALVTSTVTMEHQYVSLLFSVDGLQHPLLREIVCERQEGGDYVISQDAFVEFRVQILSAIFRALSDNIQNEVHRPELRASNQICLQHVFKMLAAMQDIYDSMDSRRPSGADKQNAPPPSARKKQYCVFSAKVFKELKQFNAVYNTRLRQLVDTMTWANEAAPP